MDLGLSLALLAEDRYQALEDRLTAAGFEPDTNDKGNQSPQRWLCAPSKGRVVVDLLMPVFEGGPPPGKPQFLTKRLAAFVMPGIELAHQDVVRVTLRGAALGGGQAERKVSVCGPGAFVVLKALAFTNRGERKDAHDLIYALECAGHDDVARRIGNLPTSPHLQRALETPQFRSVTPSQNLQAEAASRVRELLRKLDRV